ncbi:uncharacterized protein LOC116179615 [Photinus pyralis]|uniref:uncharacterized protein LOC116179615 n=1 Tax=Photinus pyralis TaxID=7054 RepID=UPI0012673560|nr:uncharacterized protein LOC116179615 [Photinus pyralis]
MTAAGDPKFFFGEGEFTLPNGDKYVGSYGAHRNGTVWREGHGTYTSEDNQVYEGEWVDDKLVDEGTAAISFPTGVKFRGVITKDKYSGPGIYSFDNLMEISCAFMDNKPTGRITLFDLEGKMWTGIAQEDHAVLLRENVFFVNINETEGMGKLKSSHEDKEFERRKAQMRASGTASERKSDVFAKSTKTRYDIDFKESKWYQRYLRYQTMVEAIASKSRQNLELTAEEAKWQAKARQSRHEIKQKFINKRKEEELKTITHDKCLETLYRTPNSQICPAVRVFRPSVDTG